MKIRVRENLPKEIAQHGCACGTDECYQEYLKNFSGKILEFDKPTTVHKFKCGTRVVWRTLPDRKSGCCEHQLEVD